MKNWFSLLFVVFAFMFCGCGVHLDEICEQEQLKDSQLGLCKDGKNGLAGLIPSSVIPTSIRSSLEDKMPLPEGTTPPDIRGQYVATNNTLIGSNEPRDVIGYGFVDLYFAFIEGAKGGLAYREKQITYTAESETLDVVGNGNDFTAYFISEGDNGGIRVKTSTVISGTLTPDGIRNFRYSFIMLEKGPDPYEEIVPVNTYRVFEDGDGLAENSNWYRQ